MPEMLGQNWSGVFLQKFEGGPVSAMQRIGNTLFDASLWHGKGSVTIWPRSNIKDWTRLLSDPDEAELGRMIQVGQLVTWPKASCFKVL